MAQGVLVDEAVMAATSVKFTDTSKRIQEMMSKLSSDILGLVGTVQNFNGAARIAFDQNKRLLDESMKKAGVQLTVIAESIQTVMQQHAEFSRSKGTDIQQAAANVGSVSGNTPATGAS